MGAPNTNAPVEAVEAEVDDKEDEEDNEAAVDPVNTEEPLLNENLGGLEAELEADALVPNVNSEETKGEGVELVGVLPKVCFEEGVAVVAGVANAGFVDCDSVSCVVEGGLEVNPPPVPNPAPVAPKADPNVGGEPVEPKENPVEDPAAVKEKALEFELFPAPPPFPSEFVGVLAP